MSTESGSPAITKPSIAKSTLIMSLGTGLSRLTGFGRVLAIAYAIGAGPLADSYSIANNIPNVIYELVIGGVLSATLVPVFVSHFAKESEEDSWKAVSAVGTVSLAIVTVASFAVFIFAPQLIQLYSAFTNRPTVGQEREVGVYLLRFFAPQIAFYGFISLATAILQSHRRFWAPTFAPIMNNLVVIGLFISIPHIITNLTFDSARQNIALLQYMGAMTTAGVAAMAIFIVPSLLRLTKGRLRFNFDPKDPALKKIVPMTGWTIGMVAANQVSVWIMLALANRDMAGYATISLTAYTFFILPHGVFSVSLLSALQPELSESWAKSQIDAFRNQVNLGIRLLLTGLVPTTIILCFIAHPLVEVLLQHGEFTAQRAQVTGDVVIAMTLGLIGFSTFIFMTRCFQAMHDFRAVFFLYLLQNGLTVATAIPLSMISGVRGLGLSQSIAYSFAALVALVWLRNRLERINLARIIESTRTLAPAYFATLVTQMLTTWLFHKQPLIWVASGSIFGTLAFIGVGMALRSLELRTLKNKIMGR